MGCVSLIALISAETCPVFAGVVFVNSRAELAGNDSLNWGQLGPAGTEVGTGFFPASIPPTSMITNHGLGATLTGFNNAGGGREAVIDQLLGTPSLQWEPGTTIDNFDPGRLTRAIIDLQFNDPVEAVGTDVLAQAIRGNATGNQGSVAVQVFDTSGLQIFNEFAFGISDADPFVEFDGLAFGDGLYESQQFVGVRSDTGADIGRLRFLVTSGTTLLDGLQGVGLEVNRVDLIHAAGDDGTNAVPEPASGVLFGLTLVGMALAARRRRRKAFRRQPIGLADQVCSHVSESR